MHDMLDPDDPDVAPPELADRLDQLARLAIGQAAADLVEQQQRGAGGEGSGQFEALAVEKTERLGGAVGELQHAAQAVSASMTRTS